MASKSKTTNKTTKLPQRRSGGPVAKERVQYWTAGEGLGEIKAWLKDGVADKYIAANMKISQKTLIEWKEKYPVLRTLFLRYRRAAVCIIENALFKSAVGHFETEQVIDNKGKKQVVKKYYPPNVAAAIYLSKNWAKDEYKDKWDVDMQVKHENPFAGLTTDDLRKLAESDGDDIEP